MAEAAGNPRIAPTAHFTAQAWVRAGFDSAELFDTWEGRLLYGGAERLISVLSIATPVLRHHLDYLHIRHAAYEARLRQLSPDAILEIGAGLSPRGLSFARQNPSLVYIEADLPGMVRAKDRALRRTTRPPNYHLTTLDLLGHGLAQQLPRVLEPGMRLVVVTEGVTDYLDMEEKRRAFSNVARLLRDFCGGWYLFEVHARELFASHRRASRAFVAMLGALVGQSFDARLFPSVEDARLLALASDFDAVDVLDLAALNDTGKHPPLAGCHFRLLEARVRA